MAHIRIPRSWERPHLRPTDEGRWVARRALIKAFGAAAAMSSLGCAHSLISDEPTIATPNLPRGVDPKAIVPAGVIPARRNEAFAVPERGVTPEEIASRFNNFYEFTTAKDRVWTMVERFETRPWTVEVGGLCERPQTFDIDDLLKTFDQQERVYRFRCVEAWAMTVPWTGFPLAELLARVGPKSSATHVHFVTLKSEKSFPAHGPGLGWTHELPWPYFEALTLAEAMNDLTLLATGIYGHQLPRQHGAPVRLVVPWKYGFKSAKSIVRIELVAGQPKTFWNDLEPDEYSFAANVEPTVPHPRWSQATEQLIDDGRHVPTQLYNGYAAQVAGLYE